MSAREAVRLLQKGEVTSSDLVEASLTRIEQTSGAINAMVTICPERAMTSAREADAQSLLAGLPIGIKDLTPVAGVRSTFGTPGLSEHIPTASDPLVLRLEARGAVVMGKTNTPEMGAGANTFNPIFGATRNPWDTRLNAGGSSGGAAAGLAAGEVWLSQGSDLGGSLRTPASFCGIVGLRPSPGVAGGGHPVLNMGTMPVDGPMARDVADCALFLDAMAGFDPIWPVSTPAPADSYLAQTLRDPGRVRIAYSPDLNGLAPVTGEMAQVLEAALARVQGGAVSVDEVQPKLPDIEAAFRVHRAMDMWTMYRHTPERIRSQYKPTLRQNIEEGRELTVDQIGDAQIARGRAYDVMRALLSDFDVLACPVTGIAPLPVEVEYPTEVAGEPCKDYLDWLRFAFLATLCGLPALSLPVGFTPAGLPVGMQLIGRPRGEGRLLQVARVLEERLGVGARPIDPVIR
ncbi:amidase [Tropicibacter naphthalenivorans]|uniref:amidase n=1 Tax=Tropicibacter naphthalenivorans TaxID=441103 RepID=UPI001EEDA134|nr:amidase family protein [Tropicibacter naphthalenivorans]